MSKFSQGGYPMGNKKNTKTSSNTKQYKIEPSKTKKKTRNDKEETQKVNK